MKIFFHFFFIYLLLNKIKNQRIKNYNTSFKPGEKINIIAGSINSFKTQIPYDLYDLNLCAPEDITIFPLNLGEIILSGQSYESNYQLNINQTVKCKLLCSQKIIKRDFNKIKSLISKEYFINYYLDNLPVGLAKTYKAKKSNRNIINKRIRFDKGIPLGFIENNLTYIYNYYKIYIELNEVVTYDDYNLLSKEYNIIGFYIEPFSINIQESENCFDKNKIVERQILKENEYINFYYDVIYIYTNITYDQRINKYYLSINSIHSNNIIIGYLIIIFLTIILIIIYINSIKKENNINNNRIISDEEINEYGWRNLSFDVFRSPKNIELLSVIFGTGIQLFLMLFYSLFFINIGLLRPRNGGSYFSIMTMLYIFLGIISGYSTSRFYKMLKGRNWIILTLLSILFFPIIFIIFLNIINFIYKKENSSAYFELDDFFSLIFIFIFEYSPLIFFGIIIGFLKKRINLPCKINPIPSQINFEAIPWYLKIKYACIFAGFPSFFAIFVELFYIMDSLWRQNIYSFNKYLLESLIVLIIINSEISILFTYFNLCKGDYRWWWKSIFIGASPGLYLISFSIIYVIKMNLTQNDSIIICLCFMFLISFIITIICASAGLFFSFIFFITIYNKININ